MLRHARHVGEYSDISHLGGYKHWFGPAILSGLLLLAGCGGPSGSTPPPTYSISGTISGYAGSNLVLSNGATSLAIDPGKNDFSFPGISDGKPYSISVTTQPASPAQSCSVINGSGTVRSADITNVQINCITDSYTVSGSVSGLSGAGLVLQNNGGDDLSVYTANFVFGTPVENGNTYAITVAAQPAGQTCSVSNGSGQMGTSNITNVQVNCSTNAPPPSNHSVKVAISGLSGTGLILQNNGGDNLGINPKAATTTFSFNTSLADGSPYSVTVLTQPSGQTCSVSSGSGFIGTGDVTIPVTCSDIPTYTIGGTASGLSGSGLVLQNNSGDNLPITGSGAFVFGTSLTSTSSYNVTVFAQPSGQTCAVTSGSGTVASSNITGVQVNCITNTYSISGTVSGLNGAGLELQNNGGDNLAIGVNGSFTFSTKIASGNSYDVTVLTQPSGQTCAVSSGSNTVASAPVTNVQIACADNPTYTIGGSVTGLSGTGLVLQDNGGDNLAIDTNGNFAFLTAITSGSTYNVTVLTHPSGQVCTVSGGSGTVSGANITGVQIVCDIPKYTIGGFVSGLSGGSVILQNNGGDNITVSANGGFTFNTPVKQGSTYNVTVLAEPSGQNCVVTGGSGTASADVTTTLVTCSDIPSYSVGGSVSGLSGTGLVLQNNGSDNLAISVDGAFTFNTAIESSNPYSVTVLTQPSHQTCSVSNGGGSVSGNVTDVVVNCVTNTYPISGNVSGLSSTRLVLQNNNGDNLAISASGTFTFNTAIASGNSYSVTVLTQPSGQTCTVSSGSGKVNDAPVTGISVSCTLNNYTISGTVTGPLSGASLPGTLVLQNNGSDNLVINNYGVFTFPSPVISGSTYAVTVLQQPSVDWSCVAASANGTVTSADITNIVVSCIDNSALSTGSLATARRAHTATRLGDGRVLVVGGWDTTSTVPLTSAEIFDPTLNSGAGAFSATGSLNTARASQTATLLADGKVLIAGGNDGTSNLSSAEIFDPAGGTFTNTAGSMGSVRLYHSAVRLQDDTVLVTGGWGAGGTTSASAEIYDPTTKTFSATTGDMTTPRRHHTSTLLADGTVLITGGEDDSGGLQSAEIYDPTTKTFSATTGDMTTVRYKHTATLLSDGKVLIVGGAQGSDNPIARAEIYDPATGTFHATGSMAVARADHTATLLTAGSSDKILVVGGRNTLNDSSALDTAEVYDPASGTFSNAGSVGSAHTRHTATLLTTPAANPYVLVVGGSNGVSTGPGSTETTGNAELYVPR